jgi:hypothetical protein
MVMMTTTTYLVALVACVIAFTLVPVNADAFIGGSSVSFAIPTRTLLRNKNLVGLRGGATLEVDEDDDDLEIESSDEEYEEEEETLDPKLAKAAQASAVKLKAKATATAKAAVSAKLETPAPKKKKSSLFKIFKIPYIVKALVNPFVVWQMTRGYFASLVNLDYLDDKKVSVSFRVCVAVLDVLAHFLQYTIIIKGPISRFEKCFGGQGQERRYQWVAREEKNEAWPGQDSFGPASAEHLRLKKGMRCAI